jgi:omega-6 fatty acid desaturase (delta-12 desaturase)
LASPPSFCCDEFADLKNRRIPFYKAHEATEAIKPLLGDLYHRESRSFLASLWTTFTQCKYVEADPAEPGALKWAEKK